MDTRSINFKSDFLVRLVNEVDWSTPFSIRFFTTRAVSAKVVAFDGENYVGCTLDESTGALLVPFERFTELYRQGLGTLRMELTYRLSNALYPDQYQDVVLPAQPVVCTNDQQEEFYLSLGLTGDDDVEVSASVVAPFMVGPQGTAGTGIASMAQTSASMASAGANVWKMTLTDGREFTFTVLNGEKGDTGAQGPQGPQGAKGAKGDKGDKGDTGARGPQGEQGPRGIPGPRGEKGAKGDTGARGLKGETGPAGNTPQIGQNGNWWIGGTDTGVKADYSGTEAQRQEAFEANEAERQEEFDSKEATRDAANQAALNCAETLSALGQEIDKTQMVLGPYGYTFSNTTLTPSSTNDVLILQVNAGDKVSATPNTDGYFVYAILTGIPNFTGNGNVDISSLLVSGGSRVATKTGLDVTIPSDGVAMIIQGRTGVSTDRTPLALTVNGLNAYLRTSTILSQYSARLNEAEKAMPLAQGVADALQYQPISVNLLPTATSARVAPNSNTMKFGTDANTQGYAIKIEGGATYTIKDRNVGNRCTIALSEEIPANGVSFRTKTTYVTTIETQVGDNYLFFACNNGETDVDISGIKIFKGTEWLTEGKTKYDNDAAQIAQNSEDIANIKGGKIAEYTSASDFTEGSYLAYSETHFSVQNLTSNANMCYKKVAIPVGTLYINAFSGYGNSYSTESLMFLDSNDDVIKKERLLQAGQNYMIPEGAASICINCLKNYTPHGVKMYAGSSIADILTLQLSETLTANVIEALNSADAVVTSPQERTLREALYDRERRNPFEWKAFTKKYFAFMNDDANTDMASYYVVARDRRVPYCQAFIVGRYSNYSYSGNDADRSNLVKCPAIGQSYTCEKLATQTYLRLYIDRRYTNGFPIKITVNGSDYTISDADDARISIGSSTSVTLTITEIDGVISGRTNYINVIATADSTDAGTSTETLTVQELIKNIVFDFGEIMAHATSVIDMWDSAQAEKLMAQYIFGVPMAINAILGEDHCKGAILPGGPNSQRNMNTELGQKYCCRYLLYADYYGTTPQYSITRYSYGTVIGSSELTHDAAKAAAATWIASKGNGFYPLFTHSEKTPAEVSGVIDAAIEAGCVCGTWRDAYEENS